MYRHVVQETYNIIISYMYRCKERRSVRGRSVCLYAGKEVTLNPCICIHMICQEKTSIYRSIIVCLGFRVWECVVVRLSNIECVFVGHKYVKWDPHKCMYLICHGKREYTTCEERSFVGLRKYVTTDPCFCMCMIYMSTRLTHLDM